MVGQPRYRAGVRWCRERADDPRTPATALRPPTPAVKRNFVHSSMLMCAHELREAIYHLMLAAIARGRPAPGDLKTINHWAALPPPGVPLRLALDGFIATSTKPTPKQLFASIARDAVALLSGPEATRLRECANPECALLFVDTSRPGSRRWCSMNTCGSRTKMAHYRNRPHNASQTD